MFMKRRATLIDRWFAWMKSHINFLERCESSCRCVQEIPKKLIQNMCGMVPVVSLFLLRPWRAFVMFQCWNIEPH